jgi:hypothetical protein
MTDALDGSSYVYDAQNKLTSATGGTITDTFTYDGLNRQVSRTVNGVTTYNVYDGWDLIAEYAPAATTPSAAYLNGTGGIVKNLVSNKYYYQDASGSTSHLAGGAGSLLEWYRYDLQRTPTIYDANDNGRGARRGLLFRRHKTPVSFVEINRRADARYFKRLTPCA